MLLTNPQLVMIPIVTHFFAACTAEELRAADVPSACSTICGPMVELTNTCDIDPEENARRLRARQDDDDGSQSGSDEPVEAQCICSNKSFDVATVAALCAGCIAQNGMTTNDMDTIMSQCSFVSTSYSPSATTAVANIQVVASKPTGGVDSKIDEGGAIALAGSLKFWPAALLLTGAWAAVM